ncbi:hypothetical protein ACQ4PT_021030 [Festuca glaucescens]
MAKEARKVVGLEAALRDADEQAKLDRASVVCLEAAAKESEEAYRVLQRGADPFVEKLAPLQQVSKIRHFVPKIMSFVQRLFENIIHGIAVPVTVDEIVRKLDKVTHNIMQWKLSLARTGIHRVLAFQKAHHPDVDIDVVTSGFPKKYADSHLFGVKERAIAILSFHGFATRFADAMKLDKFFSASEIDGRTVRPSISDFAFATLVSTPAPSTLTPKFGALVQARVHKGASTLDAPALDV